MHNNIRPFLFILLSLCSYIPLSIQAQETDASIGFVVADFNYIEEGLMEEDGNLYGLSGHYALHDDWMFRIESSYIRGTVDYTSNGTGSASNVQDTIFELRGLIGQDTNINGSRFTSYTGLGYRYLRDNLGNVITTTNHIGYDREQTYLYLPLGLLISSQLNSEWSMTGQFEFDYLLQGKNVSHVGEIANYSSDLKFTQDTGYGYRISASFIKKQQLGLAKGISITPYLKYWHIEESDTDTILVSGVPRTYIEPENKVTEFGLIFSLHF